MPEANQQENMSIEELRRQAGYAVMNWGRILAERLSIDDAWRLLMAGTFSVMQAELTPAEIAAVLRHMADMVEDGYFSEMLN